MDMNELFLLMPLVQDTTRTVLSSVAYLVFMYDGSSVASAKTRTNSFRAVKTL